MDQKASTDATRELIDKESNLAGYQGEDRVVTAEEYTTAKAGRRALKTLSLGMLPTLNKYIDGVQHGELVAITGYTGFGKTLLAQTINYDLMYHGTRTMFLSYEVDPLNTIPEEPDLRDSFYYLPLELKTMSIPWLIDRIWEAKIKYGVQAIFIDHLHFIVDMATKLNMSLNLGATVRQIKQAAIKLNVAIFLLAHTSQPKEGIPTIADIRDSSFIAQEADSVLIIHRLSNREMEEMEFGHQISSSVEIDYSMGGAIVMVEKARRSGVFKKYVLLQKQEKYLREVTKNE